MAETVTLGQAVLLKTRKPASSNSLLTPETRTMTELQHLKKQLTDSWSGEPWFGRPALQLLEGITDAEAYYQPAGQHSIAELVWHMVNWRGFAVSRVLPDNEKDLHYFEANDWREVSADGPYNWPEAVAALHRLQDALLQALNAMTDQKLGEKVVERTYTFRELLHGIIQHDIYHLGQIAYVLKIIRAEKSRETIAAAGTALLLYNG